MKPIQICSTIGVFIGFALAGFSKNADVGLVAAMLALACAVLMDKDSECSKEKAKLKMALSELKHMTWCAEHYNRKMHEAEAKLK